MLRLSSETPQELPWQRSQVTNVKPVLPSNTSILRALGLPPLCAISNAAELGHDEFILRLEHSLQNGLRLMQLREKNLADRELAEFACQVTRLAHHHHAMVLVNGSVELASSVGADGVHYNGERLRNCNERPAISWCSASCHNLEELRLAGELGFDFALLSPVMPTMSHPGAMHLGWKKFAEMTAGTTIPVYALGGLNAGDLKIAKQHGAHGISLLRQAW